MSLAATCPNCHTMFRVVADQLRLHQGSVRCGACGTVFNAAQRLAYVPDGAIANRRQTPISPTPAAVIPPIAAQTAPPAAPEPAAAVAEPLLQAAPAPEPEAAAAPSSPAPEAIAPESAANDAAAELAEVLAPISVTPRPADAPELIPTEAMPPRKPWENSRTRGPDTVSGPLPVRDFSATMDLASAFLEREALANEVLRRSRVWWLAGLAVASLVLLTQAAYWWRHEIAATVPATKPLLSALCQPLACTIGLPAQGDRLALESLQIGQVNGSGPYQVSLILRNQLSLPQRAPHLELTLTAANGDPVMRRLLPPQEWLSATVIQAGLPAAAEVPVRFFLTADQAFTGFTGRLVFPNTP